MLLVIVIFFVRSANAKLPLQFSLGTVIWDTDFNLVVEFSYNNPGTNSNPFRKF